MRLTRCTIDSSCVIALNHLELLPQLSFLFSLVLIPKAVRDDLFKRRATKDRLKSLFDSYAFLQRCDDYDKGAVDVLLTKPGREGARDRGEVEAAVQAAATGATVIVDDPWGRELAIGLGREVHGTWWVLRRFHELQLLSSARLRDCLSSLRLRGIRLPWETINEYLAQIKQPVV